VSEEENLSSAESTEHGAQSTEHGAQSTEHGAQSAEAEVAAEAALPDAVPAIDVALPEPELEPDAPDPAEDLAAHLLDVNVRLWAELGRSRLPLAQAVALGAGAIVDLDKEPDDELDVFVNGMPFATAKLLLVDGEWAIRLEQIVARPEAVEQASSSGSGA
jgi:flagellar motor switch protein FliN